MIKASAVAASTCLAIGALIVMADKRQSGCYRGVETRSLTDIKMLEHAVMFYEAEFEVPLLTWSQLMEPDPPFVNEIPLDPWGAEYLLEVDPSHESFRIGTYGEDGIPGGSGDDADVFSEWRVRE